MKDFAVPGGFSTQDFFPLLRALTYQAKRTLDLPRHGAARACPWLSTVLVADSVRRERGGDLCIGSDVVKVEGEDPATPDYYLRSVDSKKPWNSTDSPISV